MSDVSTISEQRGKKLQADDALDEPFEEKLPSTWSAFNMPQSSAYGEMATVEVGIEEQKCTFYAYKGVLSFYSGYFRTALKGSWAEAEAGHFVFEDEDVDVFERFILWLNSSSIIDKTLELDIDILVRVWLFADRRDIPLLMNDMIDDLKRTVIKQTTVPVTSLHLVYENTSPGSLLRRMLIDALSSLCNPLDFNVDACVDLWPKHALWDLAKAVCATPRRELKSLELYKRTDMCQFHVHEDGVYCFI